MRIPEPTSPGDVPASLTCNGCEWGWERYQNPYGVWLHRNAEDTLGCICTATDEDDPYDLIAEGILNSWDEEE